MPEGSRSQPASPQLSPHKSKGYLAAKVLMLDDSVHAFHVPTKAIGKVLFSEVIRKLQLLEADYFDLEYEDSQGHPCWLDHEKAVLKQLESSRFNFKFLVKFYTPDPGLLEEEYTRYLFALQVRRDLASGQMQCQEHTAVLLASYVVQMEIGDFVEAEYVDHRYLSTMKLLPVQTSHVEDKILIHHREHVGQTPAEADFNLLDTARKVELYGIRTHPAKDHENVPLNLAVAHMGVQVFQQSTRINTFSWAKIRKLSFKRKKLLIKLHPEGYGYYKDLVEFYFDTRNECKNFWKKCIEHHAFFRCHATKRTPRNRARVVSRGSSFRYSGRTQKQLTEFVRENFTKRPNFERKSTSLRAVSVPRSTVNTPRSGTLNSRDTNFTHNSTSSGSHVLEAVSQRDLNNGHSLDVRSGVGMLPRSGSEGRSLVGGTDQHVSMMSDVDPKDFMLSKPREVYQKTSNPAFVSHQLDQPAYDISRQRSSQNQHSPVRIGSVLNQELPPPPPPPPSEPQLDLSMTFASTAPQKNSTNRDAEPTVTASTPLATPHKSAPFVTDETQLHSISMMSDRHDDTYVPSQTHSTSAGSFTLTSNTSLGSRTGGGAGGLESEEEGGRRKRYPTDKAYYIAKELLMTERTYKKDLEVMTLWFREAVMNDDVLPDHLQQLLFVNLEPIYDKHCIFLREIETRLAMWEGKSNAHLNGDHQRIGDVMLANLMILPRYKAYMEHQEELLNELQLACRRIHNFENVYNDFEAQKECYLPFNTFLLRPAQRLLHYKLILERFLAHYNSAHPDFSDCQLALSKILEITDSFSSAMKSLENMQKLLELQRDLIGLDNLVQPNREFIREGCLQKLSRKGYQQRMFFLFSDMLIYTSRSSASTLQFKVHGQMLLNGMLVEETDAKIAIPNSFTVYSGNRCLLLAASSEEEKMKWFIDLQNAVKRARESTSSSSSISVDRNLYPSLKSNSSSDNLEDSHEENRPAISTDKHVQQRANTSMHVCWHRNTSVSICDYNVAIENQLSGYLLRKFKNSNGWQKLWVVFTNFCLFFYKTYQDGFPLASLPLLGYSVSTPEPGDGIHKEYVFKLQFKNHVYFFRAESQYTFERWIEVIRSATITSKAEMQE